MTPESIEVAQAISELGVLIVITAISITGAALMFRSVLKNNDKLAPAIDRQTQMIKEQTRNEEALRKQTKLLQGEVEHLRHSLYDHDRNACEITENTRKTLERLEVVSAQLENCLSRLGGTKNGNG